MREVPKKNYIIMFVIVACVVIATIALANAYNNRDKETRVMYNYLSEIKKKDLDTYLLEKPNAIIYVADKYNLDNEDLEEQIKNKIVELNAVDYFVYLDLKDDDINFLQKFNQKYNGNLEDGKFPILIVMEEGKIANYYYDINEINLNEITGELK